MTVNPLDELFESILTTEELQQSNDLLTAMLAVANCSSAMTSGLYKTCRIESSASFEAVRKAEFSYAAGASDCAYLAA